MPEQEQCLIIHSEKHDGERFRPSDWVERISSSVARFGGDRRLRYDQSVHPVMIGEKKCLFVSSQLQRVAPTLYSYIMDFAKKNQLRVESGGCQGLAA